MSLSKNKLLIIVFFLVLIICGLSFAKSFNNNGKTINYIVKLQKMENKFISQYGIEKEINGKFVNVT